MGRLVTAPLALILVACVVPTGLAPSPQTPSITPLVITAAPTPSGPILSGPSVADAVVTAVAGRCHPLARDYVDGLGDETRFHKPCGLSVDRRGNLLVADCFNHCVRLVSQEGMVTTVAGVCGASAGYLDGPAARARFFWPTHAIADADGSIYVADSWNNRIRVITPDSMVSTLAGGEVGYRDGPGHLARFARPNGLLLDAEGNVLVADLDNNCIRKIDADGVVTTVAGSDERAYADGPAMQARFGAPNSLAFDAANNLYVAEAFYGHNLPGWPRVRKIAPDGMVTTVAGNGERGYADGPASEAQFNYPMGLSTDSEDNVYVADDFNHRIRMIRPDGQVVTLAGTGEAGHKDGPAKEAQFDRPGWTAIGPDGSMYVADSGNNCIRKIAMP